MAAQRRAARAAAAAPGRPQAAAASHRAWDQQEWRRQRQEGPRALGRRRADRTARTWSGVRNGGRRSGWWKGRLWMAAQLMRQFHKNKKAHHKKLPCPNNAVFFPFKTRQPYLQLKEATVSKFRKDVLLLCQRRHREQLLFPCIVCTERFCTDF